MTEEQASRSSLGRIAWLLFAVAAGGCAPSPSADEEAAAESPATSSVPGTSDSHVVAPQEITVQTLDGPGFAALLEANRGRVVLVDFWATWCPACVEQLAHTAELHERLASRGLSVVTISLDEPEQKDAVLGVLERKHAAAANFISQHGGSDRSMETFDLDGGLPHYQLYDRQGKLHRAFASGTEEIELDQLDRTIESLLGS